MFRLHHKPAAFGGGGGSGIICVGWQEAEINQVKLPQFRELFLDISGSHGDYHKLIAEKKHLTKVWERLAPPGPLATPLVGGRFARGALCPMLL